MNTHRLASVFACWCAFLALPLFPQTVIEPNGSVQFSACVYPPPDWPVWISFSTWVRPYSGDHQHYDASRPRGRVEPAGDQTDGSGCVSAVFGVPEQAAGEYEITASCSGCASGVAQVWVLHQPYMQNLPPHYSYQLVGQRSAHPNSWYGTFNVAYRIQQICTQFHNQTGGLRAGVNDMSLPWGGLFDIGPPDGPFWSQPHGEHMIGLNADFPFQYLGTLAQRELFRTIAANNQGNPEAHGSPPNHYHLRFPN